MRVYIGPYKNWVGPYQIAKLLRYVGVSDDKCHDIGGFLADKVPGLMKACEWVESKRHRNIKVRIDNYDVWSMDHTLAMIIAPMLRKLRDNKMGAPFTDDADVPDNLKSTAAPAKENEWDTDDNHFARWDYILDEMIFAFESAVNGDDWEQQFHKGKIDFNFEPADDNPEALKMVHTDKHTHEFDREGYNAYRDRMQNGFRLFGKYYSNLWD